MVALSVVAARSFWNSAPVSGGSRAADQRLTNRKRRRRRCCRLTFTAEGPVDKEAMEDPTARQAAIYVREPAVSSPETENAQEQQETCQRYCNAERIEVTTEHADCQGDRKAFHEMMTQATSGDAPYTLIVVAKLHWFSRSLEETIECRDRLRAKGIRRVSVTEKGTED